MTLYAKHRNADRILLGHLTNDAAESEHVADDTVAYSALSFRTRGMLGLWFVKTHWLASVQIIFDYEFGHALRNVKIQVQVSTY